MKRKGVLDNLKRLEAEGKLKRNLERKQQNERGMEEIERRMRKIQEMREKKLSTCLVCFHINLKEGGRMEFNFSRLFSLLSIPYLQRKICRRGFNSLQELRSTHLD